MMWMKHKSRSSRVFPQQRLGSFVRLAAGFVGFGVVVVLATDVAQAVTFRLPATGYHTQGRKIAVLEDMPEQGDAPEVTLFDPIRPNPKFRLMQGATVYKAKNVRFVESDDRQGPSSRRLIVDFSDFHEAGTYEMRISGSPAKSTPIKINDFVYWDALKPTVRSFYFQRCGQEVEDRDQKIFHAACHLKDAHFSSVRPLTMSEAENSLEVTGGWHNGDNYDKSVAMTAFSAAHLMAMDEWNPKPFRLLRLDYSLFEAGYGTIDDLHHEIRAGLDWLRVMQRRDGGVYRAVVGKQPIDAMLPEDDEQIRTIEGVSNRETAALAATFAMATRDFKTVDLGYSVKTLLAAEKAWAFLERHPDKSAAPADSSVAQRLWAAAELYAATGQPTYHAYFLQHLSEVPLEPVSLENPALLGFADYLFYAKQPDSAAEAALKRGITSLANRIADSVESDAYGAGLSHFGAYSNREVTARAGALLLAYRITGEAKYRDAATRSVAYLFGVNPLGLSFVTGIGDNAIQHPANPWLKARKVFGKTLPAGYLVAGPNVAANDGVTPANRGNLSYVDDAKSAANATTVADSAVLSFLLGGLNTVCNAEAAKDAPEVKNPLPEDLQYKLAPERPGSKKKKK